MIQHSCQAATNHSHQSASDEWTADTSFADGGVEEDLRMSWFNQALAYLQSIQGDRPIPSVIICLTRTINMNANEQPARGGGRMAGRGNWSKDETMHMLSIVQRILPIGAEKWDAVVAEHSNEYPGRCKNGIMRKYTTLHRRTIPTGDPNCPEEVRLAKRLKYEIGNSATIGDADERFALKQVAHVGGNGANPQPVAHAPVARAAVGAAASAQPVADDAQPAAAADAQPAAAADAQPAAAVAARASDSTVTPATRKRTYRTSPETKDDKKDDFIEAFRMQMVAMQQSAEMDRQQRREEDRSRRRDEEERRKIEREREQAKREAQERANEQMMQMIASSVASLSSAWAAGNTGASAVFRPAQQPVLEGMEQKKQAPPSPSSTVSTVSTPSPPKRLRRNRKK
jgi:hypothetical protein